MGLGMVLRNSMCKHDLLQGAYQSAPAGPVGACSSETLLPSNDQSLQALDQFMRNRCATVAQFRCVLLADSCRSNSIYLTEEISRVRQFQFL